MVTSKIYLKISLIFRNQEVLHYLRTEFVGEGY